ncbi:GNAT family N-acetyltransferase [uncultured Microbacterium sp.]|uniref:GNAT family N-acetyltransferase n=1 Tax=uncultured Microbacterium sp. TaxID=191216 RepID=UPI0026006C3F|nr:GNAT family N-acetyltransferase [uncultured Microbacterium sp.]
MPQISVSLDDAASRYEISVDGALAGFAEFQRRPGRILFTHTEIDPTFQGQGLAGILAKDALADAVATGLTIVPYCPYIARYLRTHDVPGAQVEFPDDPEASDGSDAPASGSADSGTEHA